MGTINLDWYANARELGILDSMLMSRDASAMPNTNPITGFADVYGSANWNYSNGIWTAPAPGLIRIGTAWNMTTPSHGVFRSERDTGSGFATYNGHGAHRPQTPGDNDHTVWSAIHAVETGDQYRLTRGSAITTAPNTALNWAAIEVLDPDTRYCVLRNGSTHTANTVASNVPHDTLVEASSHGTWLNGSNQIVVPSGVTRVRVTANIGTTAAGAARLSSFFQVNGVSVRGCDNYSMCDDGGSNVKYINTVTAVLDVVAGDIITHGCITSASSYTISSGVLTWICLEEVPNYHRVRVYRSTNQAISASTSTAIIHNTASVNTFGNTDAWNGASNPSRISVPNGYGFTQARQTIAYDGVNTEAKIMWGAKNGLTRYVGGPRSEDWANSSQNSHNAMGAWVDVVAGTDYFQQVVFGSAETLPDSVFTWHQVEFR